jgi:Rrf2 family protein
MLLRLSKKELSAIEAVLDIALNGGGGLVQSSDITERLDIPPRYLEPILQRLGRAGILVGIRGPAGGYRLARERRRITLGDLVDAIRADDGDEDSGVARPRNGTTNSGVALAIALDELDQEIHTRLQALTIEDLCWRTGKAATAPRHRASVDFAI